jgi:hypothetical protein
VGGTRVYDAYTDVSDEGRTVTSKKVSGPASKQKMPKEQIDPGSGKRAPEFETRKVRTSVPGSAPYRSYNDPYTGVKLGAMSFNDRVRGLYQIRKELDSYIKWRKGNPELPPMSDEMEKPFRSWRTAINTTLDGMAEKSASVKRLRDTDEVYSTTREIYDNLQAQFVDEAKAEQTLIRIAKGDNPDEVIGLISGTIQRIRLLEKETGKKILDPLRREILKYSLKNSRAKVPVRGGVIEAFGGTEDVLNAARKASSILQTIMGGLANPAARAGIVSGQAQR